MNTDQTGHHQNPNHHGNISVQKGRNQNDKNGKFSIFLHKIICCGCVLESPHRGNSNTHPNHDFMEIYDN